MNCPKLYLISRKLTAEQIEEVKRQLTITPLAAVVTPDNRDEKLAREFCETATPLASPIAILADFEEPLTAVNTDGTLVQLDLPKAVVSEEPQTPAR